MGSPKARPIDAADPYRPPPGGRLQVVRPAIRVCDTCRHAENSADMTKCGSVRVLVNSVRSTGYLYCLPATVRKMIEEGACAYHEPRPPRVPRLKRFARWLLAALALGGCELYHLDARTLAAMSDETCVQSWATGDHEADQATAHDLAAWYGVTIEQGPQDRPKAMPGLILLSWKHYKHDELTQIQILAHELTHICTAHAYGWAYNARLGPLAKLAREVPAERSQYRTMILQGYRPESIMRQLEDDVPEFIDDRRLGAVGQAELQAALWRIWSSEARRGAD